MKNKGKSQCRFDKNFRERIFAEEWEKENTSRLDGSLDGRGTLDYLIAEDPNEPRGEVMQRDRWVAATVIQWLGSEVGQSFLSEVEAKIANYEDDSEWIRDAKGDRVHIKKGGVTYPTGIPEFFSEEKPAKGGFFNFEVPESGPGAEKFGKKGERK